MAKKPLRTVAHWLTKQGQILPASFGWGLLLVCASGVVLMPASGFWLGVVLATPVLWQHYRYQANVAI